MVPRISFAFVFMFVILIMQDWSPTKAIICDKPNEPSREPYLMDSIKILDSNKISVREGTRGIVEDKISSTTFGVILKNIGYRELKVKDFCLI